MRAKTNRFLVLDNSAVWDFDDSQFGAGRSARPPADGESALTVRYNVEFVRSGLETQLSDACGSVTLNNSPNPVFYKQLAAGQSYDIEFGIDSCVAGGSPMPGNVREGSCPLVYYILDANR